MQILFHLDGAQRNLVGVSVCRQSFADAFETMTPYEGLLDPLLYCNGIGDHAYVESRIGERKLEDRHCESRAGAWSNGAIVGRHVEKLVS